MTSLAERERLLGFFNEAVDNGARKFKAAQIMGLSLKNFSSLRRCKSIVAPCLKPRHSIN